MPPGRLDFLKQFIAIPSVAGSTEALRALDVLEERLKFKLPNVTIEHFESSGHRSLLVYTPKTRPAKFKVILNGHIDVVDAPTNQFRSLILVGGYMAAAR